jgi:hypothetical protein
MKITRKELRRLIAEAYRTGTPYRSPIQQSDAHIARRYPEFADKLAAVDAKQREAFKSGLDLNRPAPDPESVVRWREIDQPRNGLTQSQINDYVDEFFYYDDRAYAGAISQSGMTMRQIAEDIFYYLVEGPGIGQDYLYDINGNPNNEEEIEEVIRRYEKAISRPHHRQLGHIS